MGHCTKNDPKHRKATARARKHHGGLGHASPQGGQQTGANDLGHSDSGTANAAHKARAQGKIFRQ